MKSITAKKKYSAEFNNESFGPNQDLTANIIISSGAPSTLFTVTDLKAEVVRDIQNKRWIENAIQGLEDRYSIYFSKGFIVNLKYFNQNVELSLINKIPNLRTDGKFLPTNKLLPFDNVVVSIESGIHENYYFPTEKNYSLSINRRLTNDFGIYFICNDRVIVKSSTEKKHGWETKWHSEYNGFVCLVKFISKDPSNLPWNTAKTAMREDASLFLDVIEHIQPIANDYRSEIKNRYNKRNDNENKDPTIISNNPSNENKNLTTGVNNQPNIDKDPVTGDNNPLNEGRISSISVKNPKNNGTKAEKKEPLNAPQYDKKIIECQDLVKMINKLNIPKFNSLYKSLLDINPEQHPLLTIVGIWSFCDSLARIDPSYSGDNFQGYFNGRLDGMQINKKELQVLKKIIEWFMHEGNFNKHNQDYATLNGLDIVYKFNKIQSLIAFVIKNHILPTLESS